MSNLFKQYNVIEPEKNARVIDYNSMVEKKLAELAKQQSAGVKENGFRSLSDVAEVAVEEDPAEVLQKAKEEADAIVTGAREEAMVLMADTKKRSGEILEKSRQDGQKEGYEAGFLQAKEELETEYQKRREELAQLEEKCRQDYKREMEELEPKLLDVILTVFEKVFHIQFDEKKDILLHLVSDAISGIEGCKSFRIRVSEAQRVFLESRKEEILDRIGHDMSLEIIPDAAFEQNQCIIETDTGIFDCSLDVQLNNLMKDLRSLSS